MKGGTLKRACFYRSGCWCGNPMHYTKTLLRLKDGAIHIRSVKQRCNEIKNCKDKEKYGYK